MGLRLGPDISTGSVTVANDEENLYVTYRSDGGPILGTALFVGDAVEEIPTTRWGTPRLRRFPYVSGHGFRTFEVVWEVPLDDVAGPEAVIAAFGQIGLLPSWGDGESITPGRSWATYFSHPVASCAAESIGPAGGSLSVPEGRAAISVPAGALSNDIVITIEPATLEELQARADEILGQGGATSGAALSTGVAAAPATAVTPGDPTIDPASFELLELLGDRVRPIANTLWDFGPDGLEFLEPATVTLTYDDDDLPPGVSEEELGIFVINAIFTTEPAGVVDPVANTITASVDHFSFFYIGYLEVQSTDLAATGGTAVADGIPVGSEIEYAATVANSGPSDVDGVEVLYEISGNVSLGELSAGCTEVADPAPATVALQCAVGSVPSTQEAAAPPAVFTVDGAGDVVLRATASFPGIDTNPVNDWFEDEFRVGPLADLTVTATVSNDSEPVGAEVRFDPSVANLGPESVDGVTVTYQVFGDVVPGTLDETCVEDPNPIFADLVVRCDVGAIAVDDIVQAPSAAFVAQASGEYEVWIRPNFPGTDPDGDNNRFEYTFTATDPTVLADLTVTSATESADPIEVGLSVSYTATVENLGPGDVSDARVFYSAFGDIEAGAVGQGCSVRDVPIIADVEVVCDVGALNASASAEAAPVEFIPGSVGEYTIWMSPGSSSTNDPDIDNNRLEETVTVTGRSADLEVFTLLEQEDPVAAGDPVQYNISVAAEDAAQPVEGATLTLAHAGNATFVSASIEGCVDLNSGVRCEVGPLPEGLIFELSITLLPNPGLEQLGVVASIAAPFGVTDPDDSNNLLGEGTTILSGGGTVDGIDLAVTAFDVPTAALEVGEVGSVQGTLRNQGTDPATDVRVFYAFPATATIESTGAGCAESTSPLFGAVEVACDLASVASGQTVSVPPVDVSFGAPGDALVELQLFHGSDVDFTNNQAQGTIVVSPQFADLRIDRLADSPDPVQPGDVVTYEVDLVADGGLTVTDGRLYLEFTGDADFVSASVGCSFSLRRYTCILDPLQPGVTQALQFDFRLTTGGETVVLDASIESLGLFDDPDPTNNTASTSTEVEVVGTTPLTVGDVIERVLPAPGASVYYTFDGSVGEEVRLGLAILSGGNAAADLYLNGPSGPILGDEANPIRAQDFWSQNIDVVLPDNGTYEIRVEGIGSGFFRLALGSGIGRLDETYGDPAQSRLRIFDPGRTFLEMELDGDGVVALGRETLGRVDAAGDVVASFGSGGTVDLAPILGGPAGAMAIQPDGRIVVAGLGGSIPYPWTVARFLSDGTLDASFGTGGVATVQVGTTSQSLQVRPLAIGFQEDGPALDIVVAGRSASPTERIGITRLNADGSVDVGFGTGGVVLDGAFEPEYAEIQSDGRILVGSANQLSRYAVDGAADVGFGSGGLVNLPAAGVRRVVALAGGGIVGVGEQGDDGLVVRLDADGSPASFGSGGAVLVDFGLPERLFSVAEDAQGRLVVAGDERTVDGNFDQLVLRLQSNGTLDPGFGHGGFVVVGVDIDQGRDVAVDSQGRLLVGGEVTAGGWHFTRHLVN
ncbi:MAG: hypothetical protein HKN72_09075 [Gemmatimonadetes bacterium]|nr:hypothetical protein [Gemmatimonadota bacterium]